MSQDALEATLGRLICDDAFQRELFVDAAQAALRLGLRLTPVELNSLSTLEPRQIEALAGSINDHVRRVSEESSVLPRRQL